MEWVEQIPTPRLVAWELTRRCNLRCRHCRANAEAGCGTTGEMSFDEAKRLVDDLASFAHPILILTGGEPLLVPWLWDIATYAREKGLTPVLGTNATLIDAATAARIAAVGIRRISVSLDFPTAAEHDAFRGVAGAFEAALAGIRAARAAGVEVQINTTVTRLNRSLLPAILDLALSLDVQAFHPFLLVPTGRGVDLAGEELSAAEYEETLRWVCERQKTTALEFKPTDAPQYQRIVRQCGGACPIRGKGCLAGTGFAFVSHVGDVQPCGYFDLKLGNVREQPFSQIWRASPVFDDLRRPERLKGKCGICEFKGVCGGCRARALARTGDYLAEEPFCAHVPDRALLDRLQTEFPLTERPYAQLGAALGLSEVDCHARAVRLREAGLLRRVGASFVPRRLGFKSVLVAAQVVPDRLESVAAAVNGYAQITHNYARTGAFNLWFTVIARSNEEQDAILAEIRRLEGVERLMSLPSEKTYKLRAVFPSDDGAKTAPASREDGSCVVCDEAFVRKFQGDILDLGLTPFSTEELRRLRELVEAGIIRRVGAFVSHRRLGYAANALVLWQVPASTRDAVGERLASAPAVSHCYARRTQADWPYGLYAMVHAQTAEELTARIDTLSQEVRTVVGDEAPRQVLTTLREYKKTSWKIA